MKILFDRKKVEDREFEEFPILLSFGFNTMNIKLSDLLGFIEELIDTCYDLEEKDKGNIEIPHENGILNLKIIKEFSEMNIYLNDNLIEKTNFKEFINDLNQIFAELIPFLKNIILEEIKEDGIDTPYVIVLGKIYEWQEDFYELIDSSTL